MRFPSPGLYIVYRDRDDSGSHTCRRWFVFKDDQGEQADGAIVMTGSREEIEAALVDEQLVSVDNDNGDDTIVSSWQH